MADGSTERGGGARRRPSKAVVAGICACACAVAIGVVAANLAAPPADRGPAAIDAPEEQEAREGAAPAAGGGEADPADVESAARFAYTLTDDYQYTGTSRDSIAKNADAVGVDVDESVFAPYDRYAALSAVPRGDTFCSVNVSEGYAPAGDGAWTVTVGVKRAAVSMGDASAAVAYGNGRAKIKESEDDDLYTTVTYRLAREDGGRFSLTLTSPDWWK